MKAISLWQPWASLLAHGYKKFETRSWKCPEWIIRDRMDVAIHAAKRALPREWRDHCQTDPDYRDCLYKCGVKNIRRDMPYGVVLAVGKIVRCVSTDEIRAELPPRELEFGDYETGRFAWEFSDMKLLDEPYECNGHQQFWYVKLPDGDLVK